MDAYSALSKELTCTLCNELFRSPSTFSTCGHTFCHECVIHKLEGKGISTSQCPTCKQPGWKKDLKPNHGLNNAVEHFKALGKSIQSALAATTTLVPAISGATSSAASPPPDDPLQYVHNQDEEIEIAQRDLPSTELVFEELDFGPAWRAALQNRPPPATAEELETLKEEIALLESALQLCRTMPCAGEEEQEEGEEDVENHHAQQQQQSTVNCELGISLSGKTAAAAAAAPPGRKQARKLSELASQQQQQQLQLQLQQRSNNSSGHGTEEEKEMDVPAEQIEVIPSTEDTLKEGVTEAIEGEEEGVIASASAGAGAVEVAMNPYNKDDDSLENGGIRSAKRPRVEHHPIATVQTAEERNQAEKAIHPLGVVPDSQPTSVEETRGNSGETNNAPAAAGGGCAGAGPSNGAMLLGSSAALNTQSAAELLHGIGGGHTGFIPASQLPLGGGGDGGVGGDGRAEGAVEPATHGEQTNGAAGKPIQPFSLAFPAPAPRSQSQIVGASPFFNAGAGPSNKDNTTNNIDLNHSSKSSGQYHRSIPTTSHTGKGTGNPNKTSKSDIRTLFFSQKAAQEASDTAAPSQTPICLAFATSDQQLKEKVQAVQRKLPFLTYMQSVSDTTTHVIIATDDSLIAEKRSRIYLEGLARGCWVVSTAWLEACLDTGIRVKENIYEVKGCRVLPSRFYQDNWLAANVLGGPERCRLLAKQGGKLFLGFSSIRVEKFDEKGKVSGRLREIVLCLLRFAGATVTESGPCMQSSLVVTNDKNVAGGFLSKNYKRVVDARWVLDSVSCCKVLPEERYLFQKEAE